MLLFPKLRLHKSSDAETVSTPLNHEAITLSNALQNIVVHVRMIGCRMNQSGFAL